MRPEVANIISGSECPVSVRRQRSSDLCRQVSRHVACDIVPIDARRIRRIFPALFVTLAAASVFSSFLFLPKFLHDFSKSLLATSVSCRSGDLCRQRAGTARGAGARHRQKLQSRAKRCWLGGAYNRSPGCRPAPRLPGDDGSLLPKIEILGGTRRGLSRVPTFAPQSQEKSRR